MVLWEVLSRELPWVQYHEEKWLLDTLLDAITRGERPAIPESTPKDYSELVRACWATNHDERPAMLEVEAALVALVVYACFLYMGLLSSRNHHKHYGRLCNCRSEYDH